MDWLPIGLHKGNEILIPLDERDTRQCLLEVVLVFLAQKAQLIHATNHAPDNRDENNGKCDDCINCVIS
ncbi:MAG: hypothetical protein IJU23_13455 [Proteobacteria bacterium]|nr:hypothetical protein [Pseudomonadota bacterium]